MGQNLLLVVFSRALSHYGILELLLSDSDSVGFFGLGMSALCSVAWGSRPRRTVHGNYNVGGEIRVVKYTSEGSKGGLVVVCVRLLCVHSSTQCSYQDVVRELRDACMDLRSSAGICVVDTFSLERGSVSRRPRLYSFAVSTWCCGLPYEINGWELFIFSILVQVWHVLFAVEGGYMRNYGCVHDLSPTMTTK